MLSRVKDAFTVLCMGATVSLACAQTVVPVTLDEKLSSRFVLFKDATVSNKFYFLPLQASLERGDSGKERFGAHLYRDSGKWKASITLSIKLDASPEDMKSLRALVPEPNAVFSAATVSFQSGYVILDVTDTEPKLVSLQSGVSPVGSTIAQSFELTGSAKELVDLMTGGGSKQLALYVSLDPKLSVSLRRSIEVSTSTIAKKFEDADFLSASSFGSGALFDMIRTQIGTSGVAEESAVLKWISGMLGTPSFVYVKGRWQYGWNLSDATLQQKLKASEKASIPVVVPFGDYPSLMAFIPLGNVCQRFKDAISNLEENTSGCDDVK